MEINEGEDDIGACGNCRESAPEPRLGVDDISRRGTDDCFCVLRRVSSAISFETCVSHGWSLLVLGSPLAVGLPLFETLSLFNGAIAAGSTALICGARPMRGFFGHGSPSSSDHLLPTVLLEMASISLGDIVALRVDLVAGISTSLSVRRVIGCTCTFTACTPSRAAIVSM